MYVYEQVLIRSVVLVADKPPSLGGGEEGDGGVSDRIRPLTDTTRGGRQSSRAKLSRSSSSSVCPFESPKFLLVHTTSHHAAAPNTPDDLAALSTNDRDCIRFDSKVVGGLRRASRSRSLFISLASSGAAASVAA